MTMDREGVALRVVIEEAGGNYSAYSPDLPGCVATGDTREEVKANMRAAVVFHLEEWQKRKFSSQIRRRGNLCGSHRPESNAARGFRLKRLSIECKTETTT